MPASGGTLAVDTTTGAANFSSVCSSTIGSGEIILQWTPSASGTATVDTCVSSNFDTVLYVRQATCASGSIITCDDDTCGPGNLASAIAFAVVSGQTYFIFVDGSGGSEGQTTVTITPPV